MKRNMPIYFKYISIEFLLSFFVCFVFFFFIFFANQVLLLAEYILSKKIPAIDVLLLLIYFMPTMLSLTFPFASLAGCLMAVSRMASDNEILSMQSSGISHKQIFTPLILIGLLLTLTSFMINDYLLPVGTMNYTKLYRKLIYSNPELELESFTAKRYMDTVLITGQVKGKNIEDIIIIDRTNQGNKRFITAQKANIGEDKEGQGIISLTLTDIFSHYSDQKKEFDFNWLTAEKMIYNILISDLSIAIRNPGPREMSSFDVYRSIKEKEKNLSEKLYNIKYSNDNNYLKYTENLVALSSMQYTGEKKKKSQEELVRNFTNYLNIKNEKINDRQLQIYKLEYNKKYSLPAACLLFVLFSYPAGLFSKRSGRSVGFGIGLIVSVFYWCMLFAAHTLGVRSNLPPMLAMWFPNTVILLLSVGGFFMRFTR
ncbi:MAG: LptF/LptG family permease [Spirochaetia bacterium]|nr:LptF/LptG family permease [Spirochaetia bacterium]